MSYLRLLCLLILSLSYPLNHLQANAVLDFVWSGGVTNNTAKVVAQSKTASTNVVLSVSAQADMSSPVYTSSAQSTDSQSIVRFENITGLSPNTTYYYTISVDGVVESLLNDADNGSEPYTGKFTTLPTPGEASSFSFVFGACIRSGTSPGDNLVFDTMKSHNPLFWMSTGDFHYSDISTNDPSLFRSAMESRLIHSGQSTRLASLSRSTSFIYLWDDHDFGPNNSHGAGDGATAAAPAAHLVYRQYVPHYDLPLAGDAAYTNGEEPIATAFTVGRVRFILTDVRAASTDNNDPGGETKLGARQKQWFKEELVRASGTYPLIVWLTTVPWNGDDNLATTGNEDRWQYFVDERREIADFIKNNAIEGFCALSGDMHATAIDTGTNTDFATGGGAGFPLFHAAPLANTASNKAGPYDIGATPATGAYQNFGLFEVADTGTELTVTWTGKDQNNATVTNGMSTAGYPALGNPITYSFAERLPVLTSTVPADDASGIDPAANLSITFSETMTAGSGEIIIRSMVGDAEVRRISVNDAQVSIANNTATINPTDPLPSGASLYIEVPYGAFENLTGDPFAGIAAPTELNYKKWNFTTTGTGQPDILIKHNETTILDGDSTPDTADGTDFGASPVGSAVNHTFTVSNAGFSTLNLTDQGSGIYASLSGSNTFSITSQPAASLASGASSTFVVTYLPTAEGNTDTATITLASDDPDEASFDFIVQGTGATVNWTAYHDTTSSTVEDDNSPNTTSGHESPQNGTTGTSYALINYADGASTGATLTVTASSTEQTSTGAPADKNPAIGTDAYAVFNGVLNFGATTYYYSANETWTLDFAGLDNTNTYELILYGGRDFDPTRTTTYTLQDAQSFVSITSNGVDDASDSSDATFELHNTNTTNGHIVGWKSIVPNTQSIRVVLSTGVTTHAYLPQGIRLREIASASTSAYTQWAQTTHSLAGNDALGDADPDTDGYANLIEYIASSDPTALSSLSYSIDEDGSNRLVVSLESQLATLPSDVTITLEGSNDLGQSDAWATVNATYSSSGSGPYTHSWTQDTAHTSGGKAFLRLKIAE